MKIVKRLRALCKLSKVVNLGGLCIEDGVTADPYFLVSVYHVLVESSPPTRECLRISNMDRN